MGAAVPIEKIILFDGVCNLCSASVQFIIRRDKKGKFRFASLQSAFAKKMISASQLEDSLQTIIYYKNNKAYVRSDAALEVCKELDGLWPLLYVLKIIPRLIRDGVYDFIARNRYRWFGKKDACWLPSPDLSARFVA
jgi:predicted DCC family thiol-disulfide oxidoreductase YuxK